MYRLAIYYYIIENKICSTLHGSKALKYFRHSESLLEITGGGYKPRLYVLRTLSNMPEGGRNKSSLETRFVEYNEPIDLNFISLYSGYKQLPALIFLVLKVQRIILRSYVLYYLFFS